MKNCQTFILILTLISCGSFTGMKKIQMIDGNMASFSYRNGMPLPSENEKVKITHAGFSINMEEKNNPKLFWMFDFVDKNNSIEKVKIFDITVDNEKLLIDTIISKTKEKQSFLTIPEAMNQNNFPWLFDSSTTELFFKFSFTT